MAYSVGRAHPRPPLEHAWTEPRAVASRGASLPRPLPGQMPQSTRRFPRDPPLREQLVFDAWLTSIIAGCRISDFGFRVSCGPRQPRTMNTGGVYAQAVTSPPVLLPCRDCRAETRSLHHPLGRISARQPAYLLCGDAGPGSPFGRV